MWAADLLDVIQNNQDRDGKALACLTLFVSGDAELQADAITSP